jgi:hypothetical protein
MSDSEDKKMFDPADLTQLDLTPDWARRDPGSVHIKPSDSGRSAGRGRGERPRREGPGERRRGEGGGRPSASQRRPRRTGEEDRAQAAGARNERRSPRVGQRPPPSLPLKISFLPERKGLGVVVRRIRSARKAFALPDVARLFLSKPDFYLLKIELENSAAASLIQCGVCGELFQSSEAAADHIFKRHAQEYFVVAEVAGDPPSGKFPGVAKCGVSGELIAPPNHHTYRERISELHAKHCPAMPLPQYESRIVLLADEESIEAWKSSQSLRTEYRLKDDPEAEAIDGKAAQRYLAENIAPHALKSGHRFVLPATAAWKTDDQQILASLRQALAREQKFPTTLINALRPALRHMHLHLFKVGPKETFVSAVEPAPINPEESVSPIKEGLQFIKDNPGCKRAALAEAMAGGEHKSEQEIEEIIKSIHWLVDCGHVTEFADGSLALPSITHRA